MELVHTVLLIIFVVEFLVALGVLMTWKSGYYGLSSSYRMPQGARHRRTTTRRQMKRHKVQSYPYDG